MKRIFLIGYMGSGKTTLGGALAKELGLPFIDLDWYIEERMHRTIPELFAAKGESGFREIEKNMLHEVGEFEDVIIAAGGGTPCFFDNIEYMNRVGCTVYLDVEPEILYRRMKIGKANRPLLADKTDEELRQAIQDGLAKRASFYRKTKYVFDGGKLESKEQIKDSVQRLRELLNL